MREPSCRRGQRRCWADGFAGEIEGKRLVLMTGHRRESFDGGLARIADAIGRIALRPDVAIVFPVHPNPNVRRAFEPLAGQRNILLVEPVDYPELVYLLQRCHFVVTDSGGIQEEAPSFGKPVLVTRETTERPEAMELGLARLVGTDEQPPLRGDVHIARRAGGVSADEPCRQPLWRRQGQRAYRRPAWPPSGRARARAHSFDRGVRLERQASARRPTLYPRNSELSTAQIATHIASDTTGTTIKEISGLSRRADQLSRNVDRWRRAAAASSVAGFSDSRMQYCGPPAAPQSSRSRGRPPSRRPRPPTTTPLQDTLRLCQQMSAQRHNSSCGAIHRYWRRFVLGRINRLFGISHKLRQISQRS